MLVSGRVWKFGDDLKAGQEILPARYDSAYYAGEREQCVRGLLEDVDPSFGHSFARGDLIVAGRNFGGGHGHYVSSALNVMILGGLGGVIAASAALTLMQKAINAGFPVLECPEIPPIVETGDHLEVNLHTGQATNLTRGITVAVQPLPEMIVDILGAGGLEPFALRRLATRR
jgi:3-isopropylmalate/(R)-2-methylmalate dehydratase small subunit